MMTLFRAFIPVMCLSAALSACVTVPLDRNKVDIDSAVRTRVAAGTEYLSNGNPSEARRHFTRALSLKPESPAANNAMALLYIYERDPETAEKYYRRALDANAGYGPALNNYGALLYSQGRYEEALDKFRQAVNDPNYEKRGSALSNLGLCHEALDQPDKAREAFIRALRLRPDMSTPSRELARLYYQQQRYRLGWGYFRQYQQRTRQMDADSLWLGIRLAAALNQRNDLASYELALQNLYPQSSEYRLWKEWKNSQETR